MRVPGGSPGPGSGRVRLRARPSVRVAVALIGVALLAAACGSGTSATATGLVPTTVPANPWVAGTGGTLTVGIDQAPTGCNPNSATGDTWADQLILEPVLPSAFVIGPGDTPTYDSAVIDQAEVVSTNPQTVVYTINPLAVWSDGLPISATAFIFAWEAQRGTTPEVPVGASVPAGGTGAAADVAPKTGGVGTAGGNVASSAGYRQIKSVKASNHGRTVTVVFSTPFADWKSLFNDLLPAPVIKKVGWDGNCSTVSPTVDLSGGPFEIGKVSAREVVLVRNPRWWGQPPNLDRIVVRFAKDDGQLSHWITTGKADVVLPTSFTTGFLTRVAGDPSVDSAETTSTTFLQLEYSMVSPLTSSLDVREGLSYAIDRQALVNRVVEWADPNIVPAASHLYAQSQGTYPGPRPPPLQVADEPGATTTTTTFPTKPTPAEPFPSTADPTQSAKLLSEAGFTKDAAGVWIQPDGRPLVVRLAVDTGDHWAATTAPLLVRQLKAAGIATTLVTAPSAGAAGLDLATGRADMALIPFQATPYASDAIAWYTELLGTPGDGGSEDWSRYENVTLDNVLTEAAQDLNPTTAGPLYAKADAILWQAMVSLPLFAEPTALAWSTLTSGVGPNPTGPGLLWYPQSWALKVPPDSPNTVPTSP